MSGRSRVLTDDRGAFGQTFVDESHLTGNYVIKTLQDCEPIMEAAAVLRDLSPGKDFRHAGYIPDIFMDEIMRKARAVAKQANGTLSGGAYEEVMGKEVKKFLNDPANKMFRTWPGKI